MSVRPDPKPTRRVRDRDALRRAKLADPSGDVHHVVPRGAPHHGDDIDDNLLTVPHDVHMGFHDGRQWAKLEVGCLLEARHVRYALAKLGTAAGEWWLQRRYGLTAQQIDRKLHA